MPQGIFSSHKLIGSAHSPEVDSGYWLNLEMEKLMTKLLRMILKVVVFF